MFQLCFFKMTLICYQLEKPSIEQASWTLQNFGGYPKALKWSSQSRPMTGSKKSSPNQAHDQPFPQKADRP